MVACLLPHPPFDERPELAKRLDRTFPVLLQLDCDVIADVACLFLAEMGSWLGEWVMRSSCRAFINATGEAWFAQPVRTPYCIEARPKKVAMPPRGGQGRHWRKAKVWRVAVYSFAGGSVGGGSVCQA